MFGRAPKPNLPSLSLSPEEQEESLEAYVWETGPVRSPVMGYLYTVVKTGALET